MIEEVQPESLVGWFWTFGSRIVPGIGHVRFGVQCKSNVPVLRREVRFSPKERTSPGAEACIVTCEENSPMIESSPSRTALATSLMRALHSRRDPSPLLDDPWGDRLVPQSEQDRFGQRILARMDSDARAAALRAPNSILDDFLLSNVAYPGVVLRSRYTEDALKEATNRGTRQYVLIGAGFDSFALRRPAFSETLEIFEIDHPATQTFKI